MSRDVVIENPVINSPFQEPVRHFRFDDDGITNEIVESRRVSAYFVPIAQPSKRRKDQLAFDTEWTKDRIEENRAINRIRERVALWRKGGYPGVTRVTTHLLEYWTNSQRENKLFFCQIEALETLIYLTEAAKKYGDAWIENEVKAANESANPGLSRIAIKMATGSGKTVVMAMIIAWHTINKIANPQDGRFTDSFLIVTPGITIRDRLRVLLPNDPGNYYRQRDLLPLYRMDELGQAKIVITIFSNVANGQWSARPNTILIDSEQLESGEAMSADFKAIAAREIEEFKADYRLRFPGRDTDKLTDEDLLREVMNTVGKAGKLGERVKCVVSVSMLTEGWDANTVTHILGVRAFGTQLLCEQVVGRGLRRMTYVTERRVLDVRGSPVEIEAFPTEYAEVYGVPFSFIPCSGSNADPRPPAPTTRVRALQEQSACEIMFPRLAGYRYEWPGETLTAKFTDDARLVLSTEAVPWKTINAPIVGEKSVHTLQDLKSRRLQQVVFLLAKLTLERYFRADGTTSDSTGKKTHRFRSDVKAWLFPRLLEITRQWLDQCVVCKDNTFPQLLLFVEYAHDAADRIYRAIVQGTQGEKTLQPILQPYDVTGSTRFVDFDTSRPVYVTRPDKCHISHVVADTTSWEQKLAQTLEDMDEVISYAKNDHLGFVIPYTLNGEEHSYLPDFIAQLDDGQGRANPLNLILEVTGEKKPDKAAKVATARALWVPAVNNHGGFGRWGFIEITDPWNAANAIRDFLVRTK